MKLGNNIILKLTLLILSGVLVLNGWAQAVSDSLVYADSTIHIHLSSSDTVVIHHTDTVLVVVDTPARPTIQASEAPPEEEVDPTAVLRVISVGKIIWSLLFLLITYLIIKGLSKLLNILASE